MERLKRKVMGEKDGKIIGRRKIKEIGDKDGKRDHSGNDGIRDQREK